MLSYILNIYMLYSMSSFPMPPFPIQLFQRPKVMFKEINRVLKPGGMAICGVKL